MPLPSGVRALLLPVLPVSSILVSSSKALVASLSTVRSPFCLHSLPCALFSQPSAPHRTEGHRHCRCYTIQPTDSHITPAALQHLGHHHTSRKAVAHAGHLFIVVRAPPRAVIVLMPVHVPPSTCFPPPAILRRARGGCNEWCGRGKCV